MKSLFQMGLPRMGQIYWLETVIPAAISAGTEIWKAREQKEMQEDLLEFKEEQAAAAAAREAEALRIQKEALKTIQEQQKPTTAAPGAATGGTILGLKPTTFFIGAGLAAGVLVLGTMLLTRGK